MSDDNRKHPEPELTRKGHLPLKEFGLLKVVEFPDGTVISINTKKGEENLRVYHSSGSYHEFTSDGSHVNMASNNQINYGKGGVSVTFDNNSDSKAAGHMRIAFDHDAHVEFKKNASMVIGGKADIAALGELKLAAQGNMYLGTAKGKVIISGGKGVEIKGEGGRVMIEATKGVCYIHSKEGDVHLQAGQDIVQVSDQDNLVQAGGKVQEQSKGENITQTEQSIKEDATSTIEMHANGGDISITADGGAIDTYAAEGTKLQHGGPTVPKITVM